MTAILRKNEIKILWSPHLHGNVREMAVAGLGKISDYRESFLVSDQTQQFGPRHR
jgi:hypothetical protein